MDFGFSEEQEMLRQSARQFLETECPMTYVRKMMEDERGYSAEQWKKMAELGWMGLILPEAVRRLRPQHGRHGGGPRGDGRASSCPGPFFATVILGGIAIDLGGTPTQKQRYLPDLAAGSHRATLAQVEESGRWDAEGIQLPAKKAGGGFALSGTKLFVHDAHNADVLVVPAAHRPHGRRRHHPASWSMRKAKGVGATRAEDDGPDPQALRGDVRQRQGRHGRGPRQPGEGWTLLDRVVDRAKVALCAEMCGGAQTGARDERRVRQGARAVRQADRQLPGHPAQVRQHDGAGRERQVGDLLRRVGGRQRRRRSAPRGLHGEGLHLRRLPHR